MRNRDLDLGELILLSQEYYRRAGWWTLAAARIFGRHVTVEHLGRAARIGVWRGTPYLLTFREVTA